MKHKAFVQLGNAKKPRWIFCEVLENYNNGTLIEVHGQKIIARNVKEFKSIEYDKNTHDWPELREFVDNNWDFLKNVVSEAVGKFFPEESIKINDDTKTISAFEANLVVGGGIFEVETISAFIEIPQWSITEYRIIPSTRWEPEDVDEKHLGHTSNSISAAKLFIDAIWNGKCEGYWENKFFETAY